MTTTDPAKAKHRNRLALHAEDGELIDQESPPFAIVEPPPPYHPGLRRKLPSWAKHLRDLRGPRLVE